MSNSFLSSLQKGFSKLTSGLNSIATVWIAVIGCLILADVFGRVLFNHPLTGIPEIVKASIVGILYLQIPFATASRLHVRSTLIHSRLGPKGQEILNILAQLIGAAIMIALFWTSWPEMIESIAIREYEGEYFRVPAYPIRILILLGSAMAAVHFLTLTVQSLVICLARNEEA